MGSNALDHAYEWTYDQRDNVASITETLNGTNWEINFAYNADDISLPRLPMRKQCVCQYV